MKISLSGICLLLAGFFCSIPAFCQLGTPVTLEWKGVPGSEISSQAWLRMNSSSREWEMKLDMSPFLPDSLEEVLPSGRDFRMLRVSGLMPGGAPDLVSSAENEKRTQQEIRIVWGDSVQKSSLEIWFTQVRNQALQSPVQVTATLYPAQLNFVIQLEPARFGLPFQPGKKLEIELENAPMQKM